MRRNFLFLLAALWSRGSVAVLTVEGRSRVQGPDNCIPFGAGTFGPYTGFIYSGIDPFEVFPGDVMSFDLGAKNDKSIIVSIALATTAVDGGTVEDSRSFTEVCDTCTASSMGNSVVGDYELGFTLDTYFNHSGGGLIVRIAPEGTFKSSDTTVSEGPQ